MKVSLPDENSQRFLAILNDKIEIGKLLNALGHMTAGLVGKHPNPQQFCFLEYHDQEGGIHPNISHFPFIVLKTSSQKIRLTRAEAIRRNIPFTDFVSTMTIGSSEEQLTATASTKEAELEYYGLVLFGKTQELREFTSKFSLFR